MSKTKIYFIESSTDFNNNDLSSFKIGGSEKTLINITNSLGKKNNLEIKVFNNTQKEIFSNNVHWLNINNINNHERIDHLIAMSDANLLSLIDSKKKYLWSHSIQSIEKFLRKKQLIPFIKNKPLMILEGEYHFNNRGFFTSFYGKKILKLAPDYDFINTQIELNKLTKKKAIFTTRSDRNLSFLLECWKLIHQNSPDSELHINPPYNLDNNELKSHIKIRTKSEKSLLIKELIESRVMLNPGHKGEVFCLAAEEARELCIPIVTMGNGCLYERVEHNITGYIAKTKEEFIDYSTNILNNIDTYLKLKENLINLKGIRTYDQVADDLLKIINEN
jgi:glycosyltransferase involved in cell wall biosynthesis